MLLPILLTALLLTAGSSAADESSPATENHVKELLETEFTGSSLTTEEQAGIEALFLQAWQDGIPPEMLLPRLQEGVAKSVPFSRLRSALATDTSELRRARALILEVGGGEAVFESTASWLRAANLLGAGFTEDQIRTLVRASVTKPDAFRPGTTLFVSLTDWGLDQDEALDLTVAAMQVLSPEEYADVTGLLSDVVRARRAPDEAASTIALGLREGRTIRQIRRVLLR